MLLSLKFLFLGTGKSCLLNRFVKNEFTDEYNATIGTYKWLIYAYKTVILQILGVEF